MKYIKLINKINSPIFSLQDLKLLGTIVYPYQLSKWAKDGYIKKLKNGLYIISDKEKDIEVENIAFNLYQPSYISLEWALSKYGIIPEMIYNCTSITTKTTRTFNNNFGSFIYRNVKKQMFFGYNKIKNNEQIYLIAEPEKALLDYFYFNANKIKNKDDINELRFNELVIKKLDHKKINNYLSIIGGQKLKRVYKLLWDYR